MSDLQGETTEALKAELRRLQNAYEHKRGFAAQQADYGDWEPTNELIDIREGMATIKAELMRRTERIVAERSISMASIDPNIFTNDVDDDRPTERDLLISDNKALRDALRPFAAVFQAAVCGSLDEKKVARFAGRGLFKGRHIVLTVEHFRQAARVLRFGGKPPTIDEAEYSDEDVAQALAEDWANALWFIDRTRGTKCALEVVASEVPS